jgi:hypothetical protein
MATFNETPIDDGNNVLSIMVDDGDDIMNVKSSRLDEQPIVLRVSVEEALATIAALSGAVAVALLNRV